jgi:CHAD domain-containing protein
VSDFDSEELPEIWQRVDARIRSARSEIYVVQKREKHSQGTEQIEKWLRDESKLLSQKGSRAPLHDVCRHLVSIRRHVRNLKCDKQDAVKRALQNLDQAIDML